MVLIQLRTSDQSGSLALHGDGVDPVQRLAHVPEHIVGTLRCPLSSIFDSDHSSPVSAGAFLTFYSMSLVSDLPDEAAGAFTRG
jgi:hypothetical protein